jgi:hypothetical protein
LPEQTIHQQTIQMTTKPAAINIGSNWYNTSSIEEIVVEIQQKAHLVAAGLDEFTAAEKFAYDVIKGNTSYFDVVKQ